MLLDGDRDVLMFDLEPQPVEAAHVDVGDPDESEPRNDVPTPTDIDELKLQEEQGEGCDVMREAVLAGEEVEEFSLRQGSRVFAATFAGFPRLAEDLFMGNGPRSAGNRQREQQEKAKLVRQRDVEFGRHRY